MAIAVIGWGSLLWSPRQLAVRTRWRADGPCLPVEFARRSRDGRVTLVLGPGRAPVRTYWAVSSCADLDRAIGNLADREGCSPAGIGSLSRSREPDVHGHTAAGAVASWLRDRDHLTAAIWTALPWTFDLDDLGEEVVAHLRDLDTPTRRRAREYVESAPPQIDTPVRRRIEAALGWSRRALPGHLFDGPEVGPPCGGGQDRGEAHETLASWVSR